MNRSGATMPEQQPTELSKRTVLAVEDYVAGYTEEAWMALHRDCCLSEGDTHVVFELVRVVIEAVREPTEAMLDAGVNASTTVPRSTIKETYHAMIDAALSDLDVATQKDHQE